MGCSAHKEIQDHSLDGAECLPSLGHLPALFMPLTLLRIQTKSPHCFPSMQLTPDAPGKAAEESPSTLAPGFREGKLDGVPVSFDLNEPWPLQPFKSLSLSQKCSIIIQWLLC